jgi:hypothetical protein
MVFPIGKPRRRSSEKKQASTSTGSQKGTLRPYPLLGPGPQTHECPGLE